MSLDDLIETVLGYYATHRRILVWREHINPYWILVSEVMLQQTNVSRVTVMFPEFVRKFPTMKRLADAHLREVMSAWQGMGYNRRARYLHETARVIMRDHRGIVPDDSHILVTYPGIGDATAHSIVCFAYDKPVSFVETNIRSVLLHHLYDGVSHVSDRDLMTHIDALQEKIQQRGNISHRDWYYALMDYGSHLKKIVDNPNRRSKHYVKQKKFEGSDRQIRGMLIRQYLEGSQITRDDTRTRRIWEDLRREKLITE